jgi:tRNA nucleotidyltransferase (CCA-adding enzyme)
VARHHLHCHRIMEMRADTILKKLEAIDAFRRPERFQQFLLACEVDIRGREGLEERPYPQAQYFADALTVALGINTSEMNKQELSGKEIGDLIRKLRTEAINKLIKPS